MKPCKFTFDDEQVFCGFAYGSTWNGFDNVAVTPEVRCQIIAYFHAQGADNETLDSFREIEVVDGLVCLGWGFATQIVEERCTYPRCKCIVSTSTTQPIPTCPRGLDA